MRRTQHLNNDEITRYAGGQTPSHDLLATDDHIAVCDECRKRLNLMLPTGDADVLEAFLQLDVEEHLSYSQLEAFVDNAGNTAAHEHLEICENCTRQVEELRALAGAIGVSSPVVRIIAEPRMPFWKLLVPAFAVLAVVLVIGIWLKRDRASSGQIAEVDSPAASPAPEVFVSEPPAIVETGNDPAEKPIVTLADGSGRIEIDAGNKLRGLDDPEFERAAARALMAGEITIANDESRLRGSSGTLMGGEKPGVPFALSAPVGAVVESTQPTLKWKPLAGAESYRVTVFDERFDEVATSPALRTATWRVTAPLKRGGIYRWQVTAVQNGQEIRSPVRPAPDAQFKIVDDSASRKLSAARVRHANSHLIMGMAFAEAGLLADAEREFRALVQKNPTSPIARKLLDKVKAAR